MKGRLNGSVISLICANVFMLGLLRGITGGSAHATQLRLCKDVWYYMDGAITASVESGEKFPIVKLYERHGSEETPLGIFRATLTKTFHDGQKTFKYWGKNFELAITEDPKTYLTGSPARLTASINNKKISANLGCHK